MSASIWKDDKRTCSICKKRYNGFGNNAHPLPGRCCDLCNSKIVLPMRILSMRVVEGEEAMSKAIGRYLISRPIEGGYVHAYVISPPPVPFEGIYATMEEQVEKQGGRLGFLPVVLSTGPKIDRKTIRRLEDYLCGKDFAVEEALKTRKDFHMTMWVMPGDDPDLEWLMEIH